MYSMNMSKTAIQDERNCKISKKLLALLWRDHPFHKGKMRLKKMQKKIQMDSVGTDIGGEVENGCRARNTCERRTLIGNGMTS